MVTTNGFSDEPSPLIISVLAFRFIAGRTPNKLATSFHGCELPEDNTGQTCTDES